MVVVNDGLGFDWSRATFETPSLDATEGFDSRLWDPLFEAIVGKRLGRDRHDNHRKVLSISACDSQISQNSLVHNSAFHRVYLLAKELAHPGITRVDLIP
jgi:hypothetical protein